MTALVLGLTALGAFVTPDVIRGNQPSDQDLRGNFLVHRAGFNHLVQMLASDYPSVAGKGTTRIDLAVLAGHDVNTTRLRAYRSLLKEISVADFRYYPNSGKLSLVPEGQQGLEHPSKSYLYVPHPQPEPLVYHHGYAWGEGGTYVLTRDLRLKGPWLIHNEMAMEPAFSPY